MALIYKEYQPNSVLNIQKHIDGGWFWSRYSAFPYMGCYYGCEYCYWRDEKYNRLAKERPDLDDPFSQYIKIKTNAAELLGKQLKSQPKEIIYIDSYQPVESKYHLARAMLQVCADMGFPVFINEKSPLLLHDIELLKKISRNYLNVGWSIIFPDDSKAKQTFESRAPTIKSRFNAMRTLSNAGIITGTILMPMLPFICEDGIKSIIQQTKHSGGSYVLDAGLTLYGHCATHFYTFLEQYDKSLVPKYKQLYPDKDALGRYYADAHALVKECCEKYKITNYIPRPVSFYPEALHTNKRVAEQLYLKSREIMMLEGQGYRQFAYLKAAWLVDELDVDIRQIYKSKGKDGLIALKGIGEKIADEIIAFLRT